MNIKAWFVRHPVFTYILLTILWSFPIWSLIFLFVKPGGLLQAPPIAYLFVILGGFGPSLSGLFTTRLVYGREGLQALWARFRGGARGAGGWPCWSSRLSRRSRRSRAGWQATRWMPLPC